MDFTIKPADISDQSEFHAIFKLWNEAFGDDEEYIKVFLSSFDTRGRLMMGCFEGLPVAFMCLIPVKLRADGIFYRGSYIYAACVLQSMRGKGLFKIFSDLCCDYISNILGDGFAMLIPSSVSLFSMYKKLGFNLKMHGLLPLCHELPKSVDSELFNMLEMSDFDGNFQKLYEFYLKSDEKYKIYLEFELYKFSLSDHAERGNIKYLHELAEKDSVGYIVYEIMLKNGKESINIYDIYFYGNTKGDIIYRIKNNLSESRIDEKALWRIFDSHDCQRELLHASECPIYADILFEG